ncbi:hypothetical protein SBRCBS47491_004015 [Sporothrix bragantina]|uniref:Zinc fyve domain containing protein n=1 Tax=Sporothrix bragantina TaxID=671064 RepID=A0ABP0BK19_9PEZI
MSGPPDRNLLDRLNALKPSTISLDASPQTSGLGALPGAPEASQAADNKSALLATFGAADAPVSREDALAARLKTLRHARDVASSSPSSEKPAVASSIEAPSDAKSPNTSEHREASESVAAQNDEEEDDPLYFVDDQAVNDLLLELAEEGLGDEDEDGEDEADRLARGDGHGVDEDDYEFLPLPEVPKSLGDESEEDGDGDDDADHSHQVEELLKSLAGTKLVNGDKTVGHQKEGDSDDSDGEDMDREIRRVLEQAKDDAELARQAGINNDGDNDDEDDDLGTGPRQRDLDKEDAAILPGDNLSKKINNDEESHPLGLPTVPTDLVDPPPTVDESDPMGLPSVPTRDLPKRGDDDDISARLAALRGLQGKAAGLGQTDAFGLPSAPTFRPGEEEGGVLKRGHFGHGRNNYTDDDKKAWCIVCLEDATVRCLGCADNNGGNEDDQNNAYCTGCWQDMHVGPAAGFDERGHKRVPLVR